MPGAALLTWTEWIPVLLPDDEPTKALAELLDRLDPPVAEIAGLRTSSGFRWTFTPRYAIGLFPLADGRLLVVQPKVPIGNVLQMWEVAYPGKAPWLLDLLTGIKAEEGCLEWLVGYYLDRIEARLHRGLYRAYLGEHRDQRHLSGRLDLPRHLRAPWCLDLPCQVQVHTADLADNQILVWTLHCLAQADFTNSHMKMRLANLLRGLSGHAHLKPFTAAEVLGRTYSRLNDDYAVLHTLSGFFLQHLNPTHRVGPQPLPVFRIEMSRLFENLIIGELQPEGPQFG